MRFLSILMLILPLPAAALELECVARLACVSNLGSGRAECQRTEIAHRLRVGPDAGDAVIVIPEDGDSLTEFTRLGAQDGVILQATGGALGRDQGAGALTVFDTRDFVLTRHMRVALGGADDAPQAIAITLHGSCEETR